MPVEFLGIAATHNGSKTNPRSGASFDMEFTLKPVREEVAKRDAARAARGPETLVTD
ncbi:hypothetical protein ABTZ59_16075 [Streptomyces sp. NPDC094034]|uniref:hypothetical protein n=1 Tax=Streptomyces sp. NPDC094034 TaxID=3155309 RepID=UPI0033303EA1